MSCAYDSIKLLPSYLEATMLTFFEGLSPCVDPVYPIYGESKIEKSSADEPVSTSNGFSLSSRQNLQESCKLDKEKSIDRLLESIRVRVNAWLAAMGESPEVSSLVALFSQDEINHAPHYIPRCKCLSLN